MKTGLETKSCSGSSSLTGSSSMVAATSSAVESAAATGLPLTIGVEPMLRAGAAFLSMKPVAMIVISISFLSGTNAVPRMMFAVGSTTCLTMSHASVTSLRSIDRKSVV